MQCGAALCWPCMHNSQLVKNVGDNSGFDETEHWIIVFHKRPRGPVEKRSL